MNTGIRGQVKVLRATPGADESGRPDTNAGIHLPLTSGFDITRVSKQYLSEQQPNNKKVELTYEAIRKRLLRHSGLIVVFDSSSFEESPSTEIPLDVSVALGIKAVETLSKTEVLFGTPDTRKNPTTAKTQIINARDILGDTTSINLNTTGLQKLEGLEEQKPFVIINGSGTLSEMHTIAPRLPDAPGLSNAKVLIDGRDADDSYIIDTINAVSNPLAWRGRKIGGIALDCPKDMDEAERLKTTLAKVIPRLEMSGVMNSARGTFRHLS